jgi:hypothetical protein
MGDDLNEDVKTAESQARAAEATARTARDPRGESATLRLGRALLGSPVETLIAVGVIVVGIVVGGTSGTVLTGLGGVLISYSTTLSVVEERAQQGEERRAVEFREREAARIRGFYRQIYNTHIQILEATTEPDERATSFALITQSNRNLFFLLTEIEAIVGELDIRVASLTNRMRANMQEMEVLRASAPDQESAARLVELEAEQQALKQQLAAATAGAPVVPVTGSGTRQRFLVALAAVKPPGDRASLAEWSEFLLEAINRLVSVPELAQQARTSSLPLTMLGDVLRVRAGAPIPIFVGLKGLAALFRHALADSPYCVVRDEGLFRGVAIRSSVPANLTVLPDLVISDVPQAVEQEQPPPSLQSLRAPEQDWTLDQWADYLREVVARMLHGTAVTSLQDLGHTLKGLSDIPVPKPSGLVKLRSLLQLALADTEFCVVDRGDGEIAVTLRAAASTVGTVLPDIELVDGKPRVRNAGPELHTVAEYKRIVRECIPPLSLPQPALAEVVRRLSISPPDDVTMDELAEDVASDMPAELALRVRAALTLLRNIGILEVAPDGQVALVANGTPDDLFNRIREQVSRDVEERLGSVESPVVDELVQPPGS